MSNFIITFGIVTFFIISLEKIFFTLEINFINNGKYLKSFIFGICNMFIWISYSAQILEDANVYNILAFLIANVLGTLLGMFINSKLNKEIVTLRAYIDLNNKTVIDTLNKYNTTLIKCSGDKKEYYIILITIQKKELNTIVKLIQSNKKDAFIVMNKSNYTRLTNI